MRPPQKIVAIRHIDYTQKNSPYWLGLVSPNWPKFSICQIDIGPSMRLTYNTHWPFVKSYALPKKVTNQQRKHTKTGKESKKDQEGRRKSNRKTTSIFLSIIPILMSSHSSGLLLVLLQKEIQLWEKLLAPTCQTTLWRRGSSSLAPTSTSATELCLN